MEKGLGFNNYGSRANKVNKRSTTDAPLEGMVEPGNIGLDNRAVVKFGDNKEKSGTVHSVSVGLGGLEVLIPTIYDGKKHKRSDAVKRFKDSGKHLGKFDTPENATKASKYFSRKQGSTYGMDKEPDDNLGFKDIFKK